MEPVTPVVRLLVKSECECGKLKNECGFVKPVCLCLRNTHHAGWQPRAKIDAHASLPELPF